MVLTNNFKIKIAGKNIKHFKTLGYEIKFGDIIEVPIQHLTNKSDVLLEAKCDICSLIKKVKYSSYKIYTNNLTGKYYCCKCNSIKRANTFLEKYGVKNISQLDEIKIIKKEKSIEKFGTTSPLCNEHIKNKTKKTLMDKYGVDNISKVEFIKDLKKETILKNWGVENPTQSLEIFNKMQKNSKHSFKYKETDLNYRGKYELDFLEYCEINNIDINNGFTIDYIFLNKNKKYHSDFYSEKYNLIIEIKSSYYYDLFKEQNLAKKKGSELAGYNFIFIIDKNYKELFSILENKN